MASKLVALVTFSSLTYLAFQYIVGHANASGLSEKLAAQCGAPSAASPYHLSYTGVPTIDNVLCILVSVFHTSFEPKGVEFLTYFIASATPIVAHTYFEAGRRSRPFLLSFPLLFVQGFQIFTFGATFSFYWLLFILSGAADLQPSGRKTIITMGHVLAVVFGLAVGIGGITYAMIERQDPYITALWQVFPLVVSAASYFPTLVLPSHNSGRRESGYNALRVFYVLSFLGIAYLHTNLLRSKTTEELKAFFIPSLSVLPSSTPTELQAFDMFQWDMVFGLGASVLGSLWFGQDSAQVIALLAWNVVATPLVGPGAAFAATALWREGNLHDDVKNVKTE
ncbi:hypothetical protein GYMLUDRAFT_241473 [Collybiopsis luxurians FD-317 M1]|uniref:Uncharacterized protein n=1 Tax=Collybiopsis luxurians FD-317 M1 TaxID=944289 RepID=A0A0D0BHV0_9AGAR|nr:hypothetical protein GYMLUDRAFT_241473 [Collybiopsis luxurians FD-317 M1]